MNNQDTWCPLPWLHQFIQTNGIKTCCQGLELSQSKPLDFFNSDLIQSVRNSISQNQIHKNCSNCFETERKGFISTRQESINYYKEYSRNNLPRNNVEYLDLRYNNQCNFSCRTCEPAFSSSIVNEISNNIVLNKFYKVAKKHNAYNNIAGDLVNLLPTVKRINFTGGEPLLIKDNIKILQQLINCNNTDCEILITTNASVINHQWLSLIKQFSKVHWTVSVDGVGPFAEYIRYGSSWPIIEQNINYILSLGHSVALNTVLSAYSILNIDKLVEYFINIKKVATAPLELWFHICTYPLYLSPSVLNDTLSQIARIKIHNAVQLLSSVSDNPIQNLQTLENCSNILNTSNQTLRLKFNDFTDTLDTIRNQNFHSLIQGL